MSDYEAEMQAHEISAISNAGGQVDEWQSPAAALDGRPAPFVRAPSAGEALLAEAERSAAFNSSAAGEAQAPLIDQHGLAASLFAGGNAAVQRRQASKPFARPLSSVNESQDDDGDIEFVGTGQTLTEVLALTDRSALVDPLTDAGSRNNTWNQAEMIRLNMAIKLKGEDDWEKVAAIVSTGAVPRSAAECADAWERNMDQYTTQGEWIGYTSSDRPMPGADAVALEGMVKTVEQQLMLNPENADLLELLRSMQKMLYETTHVDKSAQQESTAGQRLAVVDTPEQRTHDWADAERVKARYDAGKAPVLEAALQDHPGATEAPQTRSELIHAALARDCAHKMGPSEKNVVFETTGGEWYCDGCGEQNPAGRLFQCRLCNEYDLCTQCMRGQGRTTEVLFNRLNLGGSMASGALGGATASKQIRKQESFEERELVRANHSSYNHLS